MAVAMETGGSGHLAKPAMGPTYPNPHNSTEGVQLPGKTWWEGLGCNSLPEAGNSGSTCRRGEQSEAEAELREETSEVLDPAEPEACPSRFEEQETLRSCRLQTRCPA